MNEFLLELLRKWRGPGQIPSPIQNQWYTDTPAGAWPGQTAGAVHNRRDLIANLIGDERSRRMESPFIPQPNEMYEGSLGKLMQITPRELLMQMLNRNLDQETTLWRMGRELNKNDMLEKENNRFRKPDTQWNNLPVIDGFGRYM